MTANGVHHVRNITVGTTSVEIASANAKRTLLAIQNQGSVDVYLGPSTVVAGPANSANRGRLLKGGLNPPDVLEDYATRDQWWAVTASGTGDLFVDEIYLDLFA